jgi:hypothetical protein
VNGAREAAQAASRPRKPRRDASRGRAEGPRCRRQRPRTGAGTAARRGGEGPRTSEPRPRRGAREPRRRGSGPHRREPGATRRGSGPRREGGAGAAPSGAPPGATEAARAGLQGDARAGKGSGGRGRGRERRREGSSPRGSNSGDHRLQNLGHHGEREMGEREVAMREN